MFQATVGSGGLATGADRSRRLQAARIYLVSDDFTPAAELPALLAAAIKGGVDIFQLRRKGAAPRDMVQLATVCGSICRESGILFIIDDHVELARQVGADGVHLGQEDTPLEQARTILGRDLLIGASTHNRAQVAAAMDDGADYISAGPVHETPTKAGRAAVGFEHVAVAARHTSVPVVAIGGLGPAEARLALESGADMVGVVRAICSSSNPEGAAREMTRAISGAREWPWIEINGRRRKCRPQEPLSELVEALDLGQAGVIVEVNGAIPPRDSWQAIELREGDRLEVVHFVGGGAGGC